MKMKRFLILISLLAISVGIIQGCSSARPAIQYDGQQRPVEEVEEIIADKLEVENPNLDLEVQVYQEDER